MIFLLIQLHTAFWSIETTRVEVAKFQSKQECEARASELNQWSQGINHYICAGQPK